MSKNHRPTPLTFPSPPSLSPSPLQFITPLLLTAAFLLGGLGAFQNRAIADTVLDVQSGTASIENATYQRLRTARPGMALQVGDLIRPYLDAVVVVQCNSGSVRRVRSLVGIGDICPDSVGARYSQTGRGEDDFLLFLEDRFEYASQVLEGNPTFRWNQIEGVDTYQVQLWDCGQAVFNCTSMVWESTVEGTEVPYDDEALEPGHNYELRVSAADEPENDELENPISYLTLRRLNEDQIAAVQDSMAHLEDVELSAEAGAIALSRIYLDIAEPDTLPPEGVGLVLEAITELEAIAPDSSTPYIQRLLGDLYLQAGLLDEARIAYQTTLEFTDGFEDLASRAAAQVGLANIAVVRGNTLLAEQRLQQARISYARLADGDRLTQVGEWLDILSAWVVNYSALQAR